MSRWSRDKLGVLLPLINTLSSFFFISHQSAAYPSFSPFPRPHQPLSPFSLTRPGTGIQFSSTPASITPSCLIPVGIQRELLNKVHPRRSFQLLLLLDLSSPAPRFWKVPWPPSPGLVFLIDCSFKGPSPLPFKPSSTHILHSLPYFLCHPSSRTFLLFLTQLMK